MEKVAYKIFRASEWAQFQRDGVFAGSPADRADGFIHLSTRAQVPGTLAAHFADADGRMADGLVQAAIDLAALGACVRWEPARGGTLFPHVYAALTMAHVLSVEMLAKNRPAGNGAAPS